MIAEMAGDLPQWLRWLIYGIQQVGFPIAVAAWLLYRLNGKIGKLTEAMQDTAAAFQSAKEIQSAHAVWLKDVLLEFRSEVRTRLK